jgi:hypothetical protein
LDIPLHFASFSARLQRRLSQEFCTIKFATGMNLPQSSNISHQDIPGVCCVHLTNV